MSPLSTSSECVHARLSYRRVLQPQLPILTKFWMEGQVSDLFSRKLHDSRTTIVVQRRAAHRPKRHSSQIQPKERIHAPPSPIIQKSLPEEDLTTILPIQIKEQTQTILIFTIHNEAHKPSVSVQRFSPDYLRRETSR